MDALEELLKRLVQDRTLFGEVEEATKQGAVLPVLAKLGWDTSNIREVTPEHRVESRKVDYCLHVDRKATVYVEVKRTAEDLERHEKQLLEYSFSDGIPLAVLTNGFLWWFYLPLEPGNWQQRKFYAVDILAQTPEAAAGHLRDFLGRDSVSSGNALEKARAVKASHQKGRLILEALPKAWRSLIEDPDSLLPELLADKVEGICGHRPDLDTIAKFLATRVSLEPAPVFPHTHNQFSHVSSNPIQSGTKQQGARVKVGNKVFVANSVANLYEQILRHLVDNGYISPLRTYLPYATSNKRFLLAEKPIHPQGNPFRVPVGYGGYFLEAHKSYATAIAAMDAMLRKIGLTCEEIPDNTGSTT